MEAWKLPYTHYKKLQKIPKVFLKKKCTKCLRSKKLDEFNKKASSKDGYREICKACTRKYELSYTRTKKGWLTKVYKAQHRSCEKRKMLPPTYTKDELFNFLNDKKKFHKLFKKWEESGYKKDLIPSIDRLDDYETYTLSNIRITTWYKNNKRGNLDRVMCINTKASKGVIQLTKDGVKLNEFKSIAQAIRLLNLKNGQHISTCCRGKLYSACGYKWRYLKNG